MRSRSPQFRPMRVLHSGPYSPWPDDLSWHSGGLEVPGWYSCDQIVPAIPQVSPDHGSHQVLQDQKKQNHRADTALHVLEKQKMLYFLIIKEMEIKWHKRRFYVLFVRRQMLGLEYNFRLCLLWCNNWIIATSLKIRQLLNIRNNPERFSIEIGPT